MFASVTSTACARTPFTLSQRVVKRARRTARTGAEGCATGEAGDIEIAKRCRRCAVLIGGRVMLVRGCSDAIAVDHW
jgi:hypothetical protein